MTAWTWDTLPSELVTLHDAPGGTSLSGQDCPACLTGRCFECLDNPERERGDEYEDDEWGEDD